MNRQSWDIVVAGGGPAGIAAAVSAAECGASVLLLDDNPALGGQIWRGEEANPSVRAARKWNQRLKSLSVEILRGFRIFDQVRPGVLVAESADGMREINYARLILCTGARERFLPFPGWTLPNVMGAGGLQALAKAGVPIRDKHVIVAGTGPLLLPVAVYLKRHGAKVELIAEQAPGKSVVAFGSTLWRYPRKLAQALGIFGSLAGIPFRFGCWAVEAKGDDCLRSVVLQQGAKKFEIECDYLACGFHLVPNLELASLLGCEINAGAVPVNELQQTSIANVYCAGEPTGIGGVDLAIVEGQIAGSVAAGQPQKARRLFRARTRHREFANAVENAFELREELKKLAREDTFICRCEDVRFDRLARCRSWREAKLYTRCGMGPCQGRICGAATEFLFGWSAESVRPPIIEARVESLMATEESGPEVRV
ncbi:MAG TPA: FAD/NAD(P)-binding oxidoreductase [Terriglobales bacterium]|nr:FAD/NAD(P)-binding oxidoreductase [Terriglobales bacterium]